MQCSPSTVGVAGFGMLGGPVFGGRSPFSGMSGLPNATPTDLAILSGILGDGPRGPSPSGIPQAALQAEAQTIDALQQAILATIHGGPMPSIPPAASFGATTFAGAPKLEAAPSSGPSLRAPHIPPVVVLPGAMASDDQEVEQSQKPNSSGRSVSTRDGTDISLAVASAREKNRLAQRRFREKQKGTIADQRAHIESLTKQLEDYKREVQFLREDNIALRAKLESCAPACAAGDASPYAARA